MTLNGEDSSLSTAMHAIAERLAAPPISLKPATEFVERWSRTLAESTLPIVVFGEHGDMRRSIVDRLLGFSRPRATLVQFINFAQIISAGQTPSAIITFENGQSLTISQDEFTALDAEYLVEATTIHWHTPHPWLDSGVEFIDLGDRDDAQPPEWYQSLVRARAYLMVLNAARLLSQTEREVIASLLYACDARQMFFVVNGIDMIDEEEKPELMAWLHTALASYFSPEQAHSGSFATYAERVFVVASRGDEGLNELRERLSAFVASPAERLQATLSAAAQAMLYAVGAGRHQIARLEEASTATLATLGRRTEQANTATSKLLQQEVHLQQRASDGADRIVQRLRANLTTNLDAMYAHWEDEAARMMQWDDLAFPSLLGPALSPNQARALSDTINWKVQTYLHAWFDRWSQQATDIIKPEIDQLVRLLEHHLAVHFDMLIDPPDTGRIEFDRQDLERQLSSLAKQIVRGGDNQQIVLLRLLVRATLSYLLAFGGTIVLRVVGGLTLLATEAVSATRQHEYLRREMLIRLRDGIVFSLRQELVTPELTPTSFVHLKTFIRRIASGEDRPTVRLRELLPTDLQVNLLQVESTKFIEALNVVLARPDCFPLNVIDPELLSQETRQALSRSNEPDRVNRLMLAEIYPDDVRPKFLDLIGARVTNQVARAVDEALAAIRAGAEVASTDALAEMQEAIMELHTERLHLAEISQQLTELLNRVSIAAYGKPFTEQEIDVGYIRKRMFFGDLF